MIRLLTAALLVASFVVVADTEVPHTFTDGTPAKASEVNANFDALEAAIDAIPEGPAGPAGAKGDTGDTGPQGEKGDTGDQGIQGEQGPQGLAGNNGAQGIQGDKGDTGDQGPAGADGRDAVGGFSHSWTFNNGNNGYGQFSAGGFVARTDSAYISNKDGVTELWINLEDSESNTIGTGPATAGGVDATGFFSFFDAGDLVSLKNIEDSGDSVIYRLTAKPQWEYSPAYASYVVLSVDTNSPAITGPTGFAVNSTYAIDFTKNGVLSGLSCNTDQIIKWDGTNDVWVCATDPFAGLNCDVGDQLRMGSGGWECRAEPITASLIQNSWEWGPVVVPIGSFFEGLNNVETDTICDAIDCSVEVIGVTDHSSCVIQVTGGAVSGSAFVDISTYPNEIEIGDINTWNEGQAVYINISCTP